MMNFWIMLGLNGLTLMPNVPKVVSGDHYTAEWWMRKCGFSTKQKTAARLNMLARKGVVEKVSADEYTIMQFIPTASFCENDIVAMCQNPVSMV